MPEQLPLSTVSVALTGPPAWQSWADSSGHEKGEHLLNSEMRPGCRDRAPTVDWPSSNLLLLLLSLVRGPSWLQLCPAARGWEQDRPGPISCCSCRTSSQSPWAKTGMGPDRQGVWQCAEGERWGRPVGICSPKTGLSPQSWAWNWGVEGRKNTPRKGWFQSQVYAC